MAKTQSPGRRRGRTVEPATSIQPIDRPAGSSGADEPVVPVLPTAERDLSERRLERIAVRAREIYEARGGEHGQALDDWLQAEREIDAELEDPPALDTEEE